MYKSNTDVIKGQNKEIPRLIGHQGNAGSYRSLEKTRIAQNINQFTEAETNSQSDYKDFL